MNDLTPSERILQELGITRPEEIDLEAIAWTQNVMVKRRPLNGCEARIIGSNDAAIITVDSRSNASRQRFSIAHELGHWKNDRGQSYYCLSEDIGIGFKPSKLSEKLANQFAVNLLLPNYLLSPFLKGCTDFTWEIIGEVADKFRTSLTATAIRMIESNEFPVLIVSYRGTKRRWFLRASQVPERWFPRDFPESDSIVYRMTKNKSLRNAEIFCVSADTWFDYPECDEYEVCEQSIRVADDEIMSIVYFRDQQMLEEAEYQL